jgi:fengycin family lipopeptide synthetase B
MATATRPVRGCPPHVLPGRERRIAERLHGESPGQLLDLVREHLWKMFAECGERKLGPMSDSTLSGRDYDNVLAPVCAMAYDNGDAVSVYEGARVLTYRDLWRRASALAACLREQGIGPETAVGIRLCASIDAIVGITAVLISGAAYVPIAPDSPATQAHHIARDAGIRLIFGNRSPADPVDETPLWSPREWPDAPDDGPTFMAPLASPRQLAYIIYTSGSTGKPKGVMVGHDNLRASMAARTAYYGPASGQPSLLLPPLVSDSSVGVIFHALAGRGALVIPLEEERRDPVALLELIERRRVSELLTLPCVYHAMLAAAGAQSHLAEVTRVILAGERLSAGVVERHFELRLNAALYNEYGPTEGTVWCTVHRCYPEDSLVEAPIGRPISEVSVYVVDSETLLPAASGAEGEIFIGGPTVARAYRGQSGATASRFIPDYLSGAPGSRLYRTGDRGALNADGLLLFRGRNDDQVKIRGYRVELGQIEAELRRNPAVKECLVTVRRAAPWKGAVVAFFETAGAGEAGCAALNDFMAARLPDFMLPVAYVELPKLPQTAGGKFDRMQLATFEIDRPPESSMPILARTALEQRLCDVWSEILGVEEISVFDHYLDLGADSIAAMRFNAVARKRGLAILQTDVFQFETVAALASAISSRDIERFTDSTEEVGEGPFYAQR